jgi:hypothetical protein
LLTPVCQTPPATAGPATKTPLSAPAGPATKTPLSAPAGPATKTPLSGPAGPATKTPLSAPALNIEDLLIAGFLDAATGNRARQNAGDYAAIATVGMDRAGYLYVLDVWLKRAAPTAQIAAMFDLHEKWRYTLFGIETNCFQQLLLLPIEEERKRRKALVTNASTGHRVGSAGFSPSHAAPAPATHSWQLPIREVHHSRNKETRIATLEPLVTNGWLRFAHDLPELFWAQLESFPHGEHDDALDALEAAISLLRSLQTQTRRGPKRESLRTLANL